MEEAQGGTKEEGRRAKEVGRKETGRKRRSHDRWEGRGVWVMTPLTGAGSKSKRRSATGQKEVPLFQWQS